MEKNKEVVFYLIHKITGEIEDEGKKGRLRRIQKKMEDKDDWKVSKINKLVAPVKKKREDKYDDEDIDKRDRIEKENVKLIRKRKRIKGRLNKKVIKRAGVVKSYKKENEDDMKRISKAGVNVKCKRRRDKKNNKHEIQFDLEDKLFAK